VPVDVLVALRPQRRAAGDRVPGIDVLVARLATRQDGVVGVPQLLALGLTRAAIKHRVVRSRLIRVHRGVYAVGHEALSDRGRMIAALLAAGQDAALSHRTAAYLWSLTPSLPPVIDVTLTGRTPRARPGLRVHRAQRLDTTTHQGLHVTTPAQTIAQLRGPDVDRARAEALVLGLIDRARDDHAEPTRSELERALLPALAAAQLPKPIVGHPLLGYVADFCWPEQRLVVETDGWRVHGHRRAFEADRARDAALQAAGYVVLRFTWRQVLRDTLLVTVRVAQVLARRG
jgi:very-short-patch-repair endonuclease